MQISSLIALLLLAVLFGIITIIHYRKKKKCITIDKDTVEQLIDATPEGLNYEDEGADYVYYDQSGLIKAYKNKLIYSHARFTALTQDYNKVNKDYGILLQQTRKSLLNIKKTDMEELHNQPQLDNSGIAPSWMIEIEELKEKVRQLNSSFQSLEKENASLTDQIVILTGADNEKAAIVINWKEERDKLYDMVAEQDYLKDILDEKKKHIEFLQQQMDIRIQKFHATEIKSSELVVQLEQANNRLAESKTALQIAEAGLVEHKEQVEKFQNTLNEKEEIIIEKLNTITWLENTLMETRQQNEMLNAMAADNNEKVIELAQALETEQAKVIQLQQKLTANRQLLGRLQQEISKCIETDEPASLVVELNSVYIREKGDDWHSDMVNQ